MHRIPACSGARPCAGFRAVVLVAGLCAFALSGCGGGGGGDGGKGGGSGGGTSPPAPVNQSGTVSIGGTPAQGQTLTATVQDGNGVPGNVLYQWMADGTAISGAVGKSLTLAQAQVGKAISVRASYTDPNNFAENPTSAATAPVADTNVAPTLRFVASSSVVTDFAHGNDAIYGLETLADDKIIAVGSAATSKGGTSDFALARYLPDGSLDSAFGIGGKVTTDFSGYSDFIFSRPVVMPDGRILVAGGTATSAASGGTANIDVGIARYLSNGNPDASFGNAGKVHFDIAAGSIDRAYSVTIDKQSRIVVAGATSNPTPSNNQFFAMRLTPEGAVDGTFGNGGKVVVDFNPVNGDNLDFANDVLVQPDGKILMSGYAAGDFGLVRLNSDGSLDTTFGSGGKVTTDLSGNYDSASRMALRSDGKILVSGDSESSASGGPEVAVVRYNPDGSVDRGFGTNGSVLTGIAAKASPSSPKGVERDATGYDIRIVSDNYFVIAGTQYAPIFEGKQNLGFASFFGDGQPIASQAIDVSGSADLGNAIAITRGGNFLVGGRSMNHQDYTSDFAIAGIYDSGYPAQWFGTARAVYVEAGSSYWLPGSPVRLATGASIGDDDVLAGSVDANYAGFSLTIQRRSGPSDYDHFTGSGGVTLSSNGNVIYEGGTVGTYTSTGGKLTITFNANSFAYKSTLYVVVSSIAYSNSDPYAIAPVTLDWTLSDEAGNSASASSEVVIGNDYSDMGDPHIDFNGSALDAENPWQQNTVYYYTSAGFISHNSLDSTFNFGSDTTDAARSASIYTSDSYGHSVRLATLAEMQALFASGSRPAGYVSGEYWTASGAVAGMHWVIDMATGATRLANDSEALRTVLIVAT